MNNLIGLWRTWTRWTVLGEMRDLCCWYWDWEDDFLDGFSGPSEEEYRYRGHCQFPNYQKNRKRGRLDLPEWGRKALHSNSNSNRVPTGFEQLPQSILFRQAKQLMQAAALDLLGLGFGGFSIYC